MEPLGLGGPAARAAVTQAGGRVSSWSVGVPPLEGCGARVHNWEPPWTCCADWCRRREGGGRRFQNTEIPIPDDSRGRWPLPWARSERAAEGRTFENSSPAASPALWAVLPRRWGGDLEGPKAPPVLRVTSSLGLSCPGEVPQPQTAEGLQRSPDSLPSPVPGSRPGVQDVSLEPDLPPGCGKGHRLL